MKIKACEDASLIAPLLKELHEHHLKLDPDLFKKVPDHVYSEIVARALASGEHHFYLAFQEETPVGFIWLEELPVRENNLVRLERSLHISGLVTKNHLRRQGIAEALLAQGETFAKEHGYPQLTLDFRAVNDLRDFYTKQGYQPCKYQYHKSLI